MRGYIKSVTKTFEQGADLYDIEKWTLDQFESVNPVDPSDSERTTKRYRVTIAEIEDYDEDSVIAIRSANLRKGRTVRWKGSKIINNAEAQTK